MSFITIQTRVAVPVEENQVIPVNKLLNTAKECWRRYRRSDDPEELEDQLKIAECPISFEKIDPNNFILMPCGDIFDPQSLKDFFNPYQLPKRSHCPSDFKEKVTFRVMFFGEEFRIERGILARQMDRVFQPLKPEGRTKLCECFSNLFQDIFEKLELFCEDSGDDYKGNTSRSLKPEFAKFLQTLIERLLFLNLNPSNHEWIEFAQMAESDATPFLNSPFIDSIHLEKLKLPSAIWDLLNSPQTYPSFIFQAISHLSTEHFKNFNYLSLTREPPTPWGINNEFITALMGCFAPYFSRFSETLLGKKLLFSHYYKYLDQQPSIFHKFFVLSNMQLNHRERFVGLLKDRDVQQLPEVLALRKDEGLATRALISVQPTIVKVRSIVNKVFSDKTFIALSIGGAFLYSMYEYIDLSKIGRDQNTNIALFSIVAATALGFFLLAKKPTL